VIGVERLEDFAAKSSKRVSRTRPQETTKRKKRLRTGEESPRCEMKRKNNGTAERGIGKGVVGPLGLQGRFTGPSDGLNMGKITKKLKRGRNCLGEGGRGEAAINV